MVILDTFCCFLQDANVMELVPAIFAEVLLQLSVGSSSLSKLSNSWRQTPEGEYSITVYRWIKIVKCAPNFQRNLPMGT